MSPTPENTRPARNRVPANSRAGILWLLALATVVALAGCGDKGDDEVDQGDDEVDQGVLIAKVGDTEIMSKYYQDRLSLMETKDLPVDENGQPIDTATLEGKSKFLEILINKEVMSQTALALGYGNDPEIEKARQSITAYHAGLALWAREIEEPANTVTEEQLQDFYAKMGSSRHCRYVITNFLDQAEEAREMALAGADWMDIVEKYHDGGKDPRGKYEINVPYGQFKLSYENGVFGPEIGSISKPLETVYGFWVLAIDSEKPGNPPPLEKAKAKILDTTRGRIISKEREAFKKELRQDYGFFLNEDALWKCYQGLPATEDLFYPGTKNAVRSEDLKPLEVSPADMELPLYGYTTSDGEKRAYTLGDYKIHFDQMSVFQRPKLDQMLGGLRSKITDEMDRIFVDFAARDRGYYEDETVVFKVDAKIEEVLVNKLYNETITYDDKVTPEQLDAFWAEHSTDYDIPETRSGKIVICLDEATAEKAHSAAVAGKPWRDILVKFGSDPDNKARAGSMKNIRVDGNGPILAELVALSVGEVSPVAAVGDGRYAVVKLESITEPHGTDLSEITEDVGKRMRQLREEEAFQTALKQWKQDIAIVTYPEKMAGLKSWRELTIPPTPDNLVSREQ